MTNFSFQNFYHSNAIININISEMKQSEISNRLNFNKIDDFVLRITIPNENQEYKIYLSKSIGKSGSGDSGSNNDNVVVALTRFAFSIRGGDIL